MSAHNISSHKDATFRHADHSSFYKDSSHNTDFETSELNSNERLHKAGLRRKKNIDTKGREFANKQTGKLKDIAMKVDWTPLSSGGANFKTSFLKNINSSRLEVHKSTGGILFAGLFASVRTWCNDNRDFSYF